MKAVCGTAMMKLFFVAAWAASLVDALKSLQALNKLKEKSDDAQDKLDTAQATYQCLNTVSLEDQTTCDMFMALERGWFQGCDTVFEEMDEMSQGLACIEALECKTNSKLPDVIHGQCLERCEVVKDSSNETLNSSNETLNQCEDGDGTLCGFYDGYHVKCVDSYIVKVGYNAVCDTGSLTMDLRYGYVDASDIFVFLFILIGESLPMVLLACLGRKLRWCGRKLRCCCLRGNEEEKEDEEEAKTDAQEEEEPVQMTFEGTCNNALLTFCAIRASRTFFSQEIKLWTTCGFVVYGSSLAYLPFVMTWVGWQGLEIPDGLSPSKWARAWRAQQTKVQKYVYFPINSIFLALGGVFVIPLACLGVVYYITAFPGMVAHLPLLFVSMIIILPYFCIAGGKNDKAGLSKLLMTITCVSMVPAWGLYKGVGWHTIVDEFFDSLFSFDFNFSLPNFLAFVVNFERVFHALQLVLTFNINIPSGEVTSLALLSYAFFRICRCLRNLCCGIRRTCSTSNDTGNTAAASQPHTAIIEP
mmetsp:Transcript_71021/g.123184  ORF Transcript_71021/g.123184 Transcript_71021/m.123184 type:complete len:529 (+) Transcript_71021:42-1628(+)